jgi:hypothetical protein
MLLEVNFSKSFSLSLSSLGLSFAPINTRQYFNDCKFFRMFSEISNFLLFRWNLNKHTGLHKILSSEKNGTVFSSLQRTQTSFFQESPNKSIAKLLILPTNTIADVVHHSWTTFFTTISVLVVSRGFIAKTWKFIHLWLIQIIIYRAHLTEIFIFCLCNKLPKSKSLSQKHENSCIYDMTFQIIIYRAHLTEIFISCLCNKLPKSKGLSQKHENSSIYDMTFQIIIYRAHLTEIFIFGLCNKLPKSKGLSQKHENSSIYRLF